MSVERREVVKIRLIISLVHLGRVKICLASEVEGGRGATFAKTVFALAALQVDAACDEADEDKAGDGDCDDDWRGEDLLR